ncbi:uncharacterized protein TNCV_3029841 [Trichonephila clavipes]|nr:uncharacterized protein TNCV_3029841 [Trichonephila clavipes]
MRVYRPRHSDSISSDSHLETPYDGQRSSDRSSRSQPGKFTGSRKTSNEQSNGHKSSKGNAGWEDPRLKRKVESNGSGDRKNLKRRPNNPSQGSQSIAGPSHQQDFRQDKSPTEGSRHEGSGQYNKARETKTTKNGTNRAAERGPVRSKQATALDSVAIGVSSRPKLTGIVRGKAFLHVLHRRPIGCPDSRKRPYNARCDGYDREQH